MFKKAERTDLSQISLTGLRALVFIGLLIVKPRSLEEIKRAFISLEIMGESHSNDILRIDLNTIKTMGCEIDRCSHKTGFKYVLRNHPFSLNISKDEVLAFKKVYNMIKKTANITTLIEYDILFKKIADHIYNEEVKEILLGISVFKYFDIDYIKDLLCDCKLNRGFKLVYKRTDAKTETIKNIIAQELVCKNDKVYIYGYNKDKKEPIILNLRNVQKILNKTFQKEEVSCVNTQIKFNIKKSASDLLNNNEKIIDENANEYLVKGTYHNDFLATQRILSFGANCTVVEPVEFKEIIVNKVKEMSKIYEHKASC